MTDFFKNFIDFLINIDFKILVNEYHNWTYFILFLIIFCETGLVVTPFLPGDSLLFAAGAAAAIPDLSLNIIFIIILLIIAAFTGDNTNYFIGRYLGLKVYEKDYKLIKKKYLIKTHNFYEKHGGKTLIIARFMPIIRTFAPFVAGVGTMRYLRFFSFSILGNILWVISFSMAGYIIGNQPIVKRNFTLVIIGIIFISLVPMITAIIRKFWYQYKSRNQK